jgi:hypothetical protein
MTLRWRSDVSELVNVVSSPVQDGLNGSGGLFRILC